MIQQGVSSCKQGYIPFIKKRKNIDYKSNFCELSKIFSFISKDYPKAFENYFTQFI